MPRHSIKWASKCCVCGYKPMKGRVSDICFFRFPRNRSELFKEWVKAIRTNKSRYFILKKNKHVCSSHFSSSCWDGQLRLKDDAVPNQFQPIPMVTPRADFDSAIDLPQEEMNLEDTLEEEDDDDDEEEDRLSLSPPRLRLIDEHESPSALDDDVKEPPILKAQSSSESSEKELNSAECKLVLEEQELVEVDGQKIMSFSSAEDLEGFSAQQDSLSSAARLRKTNDFRQIKGWREKFAGAGEDIVEVEVEIQEEEEEDDDNEEEENSSPSSAEETITANFASYAASAIIIPSVDTQVSIMDGCVDVDEMPSADLQQQDEESFDDVVFLDDSYSEDYDVPGGVATEVGEAPCGKSHCTLGCLCDTLMTSSVQRKEHCSRLECMLQCVCGFQSGKRTGCKSFFSLMKGNEAFYSKINWSGKRQRRERTMPKRFRDSYLLDGDVINSSPKSSPKSSERKRTSRDVEDEAELEVSKDAKPEPFQLKIVDDHVGLLRWNCYLRLKTVYVPPDLGVQCTEHTRLNCQCLTADCRIVRIAPQLQRPPNAIPAPTTSPTRATRETPVAPAVRETPVVVPGSPAKPAVAAMKPSRNVAKKHTGTPIVRSRRFQVPKEPVAVQDLKDLDSSEPEATVLDDLKKIDTNFSSVSDGSATSSGAAAESTDTVKSAVSKPANNVVLMKITPAMAKMQKLLQDERFQLTKLINQEKTRAFDEEVDLVVRNGQTVQVVAWIRFHRIYHAEKMHIRILSRKSGPLILVMRPHEILAADITTDIQNMRDDPSVPHIVKELLDPFVSPSETTRYAFLLCDGIKWELVGCLSMNAPVIKKPESTLPMKVVALKQSEAPPKLMKTVLKTLPQLTKKRLPMILPKSLDPKQKILLLEERLSEINAKLKTRPDSHRWPKAPKITLVPSNKLLEEQSEEAKDPETGNGSSQSQSPEVGSTPTSSPDPSGCLYPASEKLAQLSQLFKSDNFIGGDDLLNLHDEKKSPLSSMTSYGLSLLNKAPASLELPLTAVPRTAPDWKMRNQQLGLTETLVKSYAHSFLASLNGAASNCSLISSKNNGSSPDLTSDLSSSAFNPLEAECIFPTPSSVTVCSVQLPNGECSERLKVTFEALTGEWEHICPSDTTTSLPLFNSDDQWCLVSVCSVPESGLQIPGLPIFIPHSALKNVSTTAHSLKERVTCPLHVVGDHCDQYPILKKKGFGIYGSPQLAYHVFVGPFPREYLEEHPVSLDCMRHIHSQTPTYAADPLGSRFSDDEHDVDPVCSSLLEVCINEEEPEDSMSHLYDDKGMSDIDIVDEPLPEETPFQSPSPSPPPSPFKASPTPDSVEMSGARKPQQVFMARVKGLPSTTVAVFADNVVVKHPLHPEQHFTFKSVAEVKHWLQSLTVLKRCGEISVKTKRKADSDSEELISAANPLQSKRFREIALKAKRMERNAAASLVSPPNPSKRSSVQRQLHIRKEQERREVMGRLVKELNTLIAPELGVRSKLAVLKHATVTIKNLQRQSQEMATVFERLKAQRKLLLSRGERIDSTASKSFKEAFKDFKTWRLPTSHLAFKPALKWPSRWELAANPSNQAEEIANSTLYSDSEDIDVTS